METHKKLGDHVTAGDTLFTVYAEDEARLEPAAAILRQCFTLHAERPAACRAPRTRTRVAWFDGSDRFGVFHPIPVTEPLPDFKPRNRRQNNLRVK